MNNLKEKINSLLPWYDCVLPFSKLEVSFTPFKVKDAKNISIILQEENSILGLKHLIEILKNNTNLKGIDNLCLADAEYLFLQIRSKSVEEQLNLLINGKQTKVNINDIKTKNELVEKQTIECGNLKLILKTPNLKTLLTVDVKDPISYAKSSINSIVLGNEIFEIEKFIPNEIKEIIDNLPIYVLNKIENVKHPELFVNLSADDKECEVSGRLTFFTFR
jgi:hypothetical protein